MVAFGGRPLPQPNYSAKQDNDDVAEGRLVRQVIVADDGMRLTRVEHSKLDLRVELTEHAKNQHLVSLKRALRIRFPAPGNEEIVALVEIQGSTGRKWFVF